jgi:formylmethanofuran dehydrogenase subunit E
MAESGLVFPKPKNKLINRIKEARTMKTIIMTTGALFIMSAFIGCTAASPEKQAPGNAKEVAPLKGQGIKEIRPNITETYDDKKWQRCIEFHGHECGGLAIGFRVAQAAIEKLHLTFSKDEKIICVTECNNCPNDAIQVMLSCTFGKGNLIYYDTGKFIFNFFNLKTGENIRISRKASEQKAGNSEKEPAQDQKRLNEEYILKAPLDELFEFKQPAASASEAMSLYARKGKSIACELCGEQTREDKIQLQDGKKICLECFKKE